MINIPLRIQFCWNDTDIERILEEGADSQDCNGLTPLHLAISMERRDTVQVLLDHGTSVKLKTKKGYTALQFAVEAQTTESIIQLLQIGIDMNSRDSKGRTALHAAVSEECEHWVALLLEAGADVKCKNNDGRTPLHIACDTASPQICTLLLRSGADINGVDNDDQTPLHVAAQTNNTETVETLLLAGADVDAVDRNGRTALHWAARMDGSRGIENVKILLEAGASPNNKDAEGCSPLHLTFCDEIAEYLMLKGGRLDEKNNYGRTPFDISVEDGNMTMTKLMIKLLVANVINNQYSSKEALENCLAQSDDLYVFRSNCITELEEMKKHLVGNSTLCLFKIISDSSDPVFLSRADEIEYELDIAEELNEYPIYMSLLRCRVQEGVRRKALLDEATDTFPRMNPALNITEIRRMILAKVTNEDLRNIIKAFELKDSLNHIGV